MERLLLKPDRAAVLVQFACSEIKLEGAETYCAGAPSGFDFVGHVDIPAPTGASTDYHISITRRDECDERL